MFYPVCYTENGYNRMDVATMRGFCTVNQAGGLERSATKSVVCSPCFLSSGSPASWSSYKSEQQRRVTKTPCFWPQNLKEALQGHEVHRGDYNEKELEERDPTNLLNNSKMFSQAMHDWI